MSASRSPRRRPTPHRPRHLTRLDEARFPVLAAHLFDRMQRRAAVRDALRNWSLTSVQFIREGEDAIVRWACDRGVVMHSIPGLGDPFDITRMIAHGATQAPVTVQQAVRECVPDDVIALACCALLTADRLADLPRKILVSIESLATPEIVEELLGDADGALRVAAQTLLVPHLRVSIPGQAPSEIPAKPALR